MKGQIDFESMPWEDTPYSRVYVSCLKEGKHFSVHAVRLDAGGEIRLHYHEREDEWTEMFFFPRGGQFEFRRRDAPKEYSGPTLVCESIAPREVYGIRNTDSSPLYFLSMMKPGFTGFGEIVPVE